MRVRGRRENEFRRACPELVEWGRLNFRLLRLAGKSLGSAAVLYEPLPSPFCHPERSRGICSSADLSWKGEHPPQYEFPDGLTWPLGTTRGAAFTTEMCMKTNKATLVNRKLGVVKWRGDNSIERHIPRFQWWTRRTANLLLFHHPTNPSS
jgi:hypothetical protein